MFTSEDKHGRGDSALRFARYTDESAAFKLTSSRDAASFKRGLQRGRNVLRRPELLNAGRVTVFFQNKRTNAESRRVPKKKLTASPYFSPDHLASVERIAGRTSRGGHLPTLRHQNAGRFAPEFPLTGDVADAVATAAKIAASVTNASDPLMQYGPARVTVRGFGGRPSRRILGKRTPSTFSEMAPVAPAGQPGSASE